MKDKHGHDYEQLTAHQMLQLVLWEEKLKPEIADAVRRYCQATDLAADENGTHRVYRGQDLVQIIMDWPNLKPCYAPNNTNPTPEDLL